VTGPGNRAPGLITESTATYHLLRHSLGLYLRLRHKLKVTGGEHVPKSGGALIVCNHQSFLDIPLLAASSRRHISFVARRTLAQSGALAFIMRECGAVQINRGSGDRAALREMVERLKGGDLMAIFPEGTRSANGRVQEFKGGALLAARKAEVPIVPAAIRGTHGIMPKNQQRPGPGRISLRFLPQRSAQGKGALEEIRRAIEESVGDGDCP
jgi:1-acyl-sn-glycerol-3-phosphate acyltransferase